MHTPCVIFGTSFAVYTQNWVWRKFLLPQVVLAWTRDTHPKQEDMSRIIFPTAVETARYRAQYFFQRRALNDRGGMAAWMRPA